MRRKFFNIWGGGEPAMPTSILVEGYCKNVHARINVHMKTHVHAPKCSYSHACMHACTHICMHACICRYIKTIIYLHSYMKVKASALYDIEFRESDVSPGRTEVKQGKGALAWYGKLTWESAHA